MSYKTPEELHVNLARLNARERSLTCDARDLDHRIMAEENKDKKRDLRTQLSHVEYELHCVQDELLSIRVLSTLNWSDLWQNIRRFKRTCSGADLDWIDRVEGSGLSTANDGRRYKTLLLSRVFDILPRRRRRSFAT